MSKRVYTCMEHELQRILLLHSSTLSSSGAMVVAVVGILVVVVVGSGTHGLAMVPIMVVHNVLQCRDHIYTCHLWNDPGLSVVNN